MSSLPVSRRHALVVAAILLALLALAGRTLAGAGGATAQPAASLVPEQSQPAAAQRLTVHVAGAVRRPGLYRLAEGKRVADAVARAGGATPKADTAAINLAAPLADGIQVLVPSRVVVAAGSAAAGSEAAPAAAAPVSLSSATMEQLDALPGVGPVTAQKIVDYRAEHGGFRSVDDLDAIPGIGPARLEQLREVAMP
jgi:competence protein ComEA